MTRAALYCALSAVAGELTAWLLLVPATLSPESFFLLNVLAAGMFCVGLASAANGQQTESIAQVLYEVENPAPARQRSAALRSGGLR